MLCKLGNMGSKDEDESISIDVDPVKSSIKKKKSMMLKMNSLSKAHSIGFHMRR